MKDINVTTAPQDPGGEQMNCSNISVVDSDDIFQKNVEAYAVPIVFTLIFIIGIVGNGTTIFIVLHNKVMRNVPNIFIVSLATGDLLLLLTSVPFTATIYTFKQWPYGRTICKLNETLQTMSLGISVFTLTVLSWDRYNAISRPMQQARGSSLKRTILTAVLVWIASFCLALVDAVGTDLYTYKHPCYKDLTFCFTELPSWGDRYQHFHTIFRFLIYFALPMICICFFYISMARTLIQSSKTMLNGRQANCTSARKQVEARKKVARVVLSFVIVFIMCWFPRHIYTFCYVFAPGSFNLSWHIFKIASFCFSFINSCMNPLALYFLSRQFRRYYFKYLLCCCPINNMMIPNKGKINMTRQCRNGAGTGNGGGHSSYDGYTCMVTTTRPNAIHLHGVGGGKQHRGHGQGVYTEDTTRIISTSPSPSHKMTARMITRSPSPSHKNNVFINMYRRDDTRNKHRLTTDLC